MIFPPLFFNSIKHLLINLTYKTKFRGLTHDEWMYLVKRLGITCILSAYYVCLKHFFSIYIYFHVGNCLTLKKGLKTWCMLRLWYTRLILLKGFQYLFRIILSLIWEQELFAFQDMMIVVVKFFRVEIYQYFPILDMTVEEYSFENIFDRYWI